MATITTRPRRRAVQPSPPRPQGPALSEPDSGASFIEPERRTAMISEAAYFLSERRNFCPGSELEDWLAAERSIDRELAPHESAS